jgi:hypothetical protein
MIGTAALWLVLAMLGGPLVAQESTAVAAPARIKVMLLASGGIDAASSGKADVDSLFRNAMAGYSAGLLSELTMGGYEAASLDQSLSAAGQTTLAAFLEKPGATSFAAEGQEFDGDTVARLVEAASVVMPIVQSWDAAYEGEGEKAAYRARVTVRIGVWDSRRQRLLDPLSLTSVGSDPTDPAAAIDRAGKSAAALSARSLMELPPFRASAIIAELAAGEVVIDYGTMAGVLAGDEFDVFDPDMPDGPSVGRLVVRDAQARLSFAQVVWVTRPLRTGDRMVAAVRQPVQGGAMLTCMVDMPLDSQGVLHPALSGIGSSVRIAFNQGLFMFRPLIDLGLFFMPGTSFFEAGYGLPVSFMGGGEMLLRLGVFTVAPNLLLGAIFLVPFLEGEDWAVGGLRAQAGLRLSLRITDGLECYLEPGWAVVFSGGAFNGLIASAGVILR